VTADHEKPVLRLLRPLTAEDLAELWRKLTGREPTPAGCERFRQTAARVNSKAKTT
jgi:hypothetical protein